MNVRTLITFPNKLSDAQSLNLVDHIASGEQVNSGFVEAGVPRSQLVGSTISGDDIISSAILKIPLKSYTQKVFRKAGVDNALNFKYELGYIATNPDFEGKGLCQALLKELFSHINHLDFFATTRKPSMLHILQKFGMQTVGKIYDGDLRLLLNSPGKLSI